MRATCIARCFRAERAGLYCALRMRRSQPHQTTRSSVFSNTDDGHEAASRAAFLAIAEKEIAAAGGAQVVHKNTASGHASFQDLRAICFAQVEENVLGR